MLKIIRSMLLQKKFLSGGPKANQYEMVLYNEKPRTLYVVGLDSNKKGQYPHGINTILSKHSKTLCSSNENHLVLHTNSCINTPVIKDRIDNNEAPVIKFKHIVKWLAKTPDSDSRDPVQPGTRIGRLDAANEAGFFHRTDRSRLKELKKKLKDKVETEPTEPKKTG